MLDNGFGHITTIEHSEFAANIAANKLTSMGFNNFKVVVDNVFNFIHHLKDETYDMLHLDTELAIRYKELDLLLPRLTKNGIVIIHDLGDVHMPEFGPLPKCFDELNCITFRTVHGCSIFQRKKL